MSCKDCKDSIISQTPSQIGKTNCTATCPEEIVCLDIIPSSCVFYSGGNLVCSDINYSDTVTEAIVKINAKLCEVTTSCTVSISADDTCCGYLESKIIAGIGISIVKANPGGCETLMISTNPSVLTWTDIVLPSNKLIIVALHQIPQYSTPDALGRVWFRGSFMNAFSVGITSTPTVFPNLLPAGRRPVEIRTSFNGSAIIVGAAAGTPATPLLRIAATGQMAFECLTFGGLTQKCLVFFSLDGLSIETN